MTFLFEGNGIPSFPTRISRTHSFFPIFFLFSVVGGSDKCASRPLIFLFFFFFHSLSTSFLRELLKNRKAKGRKGGAMNSWSEPTEQQEKYEKGPSLGSRAFHQTQSLFSLFILSHLPLPPFVLLLLLSTSSSSTCTCGAGTPSTSSTSGTSGSTAQARSTARTAPSSRPCGGRRTPSRW